VSSRQQAAGPSYERPWAGGPCPGPLLAAVVAPWPGHSCALVTGTDPLIIDQPEDDLDNRYIYDQVVRQLADVADHRQVIVATHTEPTIVWDPWEFLKPREPVTGSSTFDLGRLGRLGGDGDSGQLRLGTCSGGGRRRRAGVDSGG
jgi:hypothetical protein